MGNNTPSDQFPTTLADLAYHLPDAETNQSFYHTLSALRKSTLSISNRLKSVLQDADFVEALHKSLSPRATSAEKSSSSPLWPLIPNERSGSWPLDPELKAYSQAPYISNSNSDQNRHPVSAYFKSTDGHISQWAFSLRRLNLPVLGMLGQAGTCSCGCILIDTTRRGKSYPDALRRTVPIWCAVWNKLLFPELQDSGICDFQGFRLDDGEVSQIAARIPGFVSDLKTLGLNLKGLRDKAQSPIRCVWISQPARKQDWDSCFDDLRERIEDERRYWRGKAKVRNVNILGAGDDTEHWSHGLTAKSFWDNKERLMNATRHASEDDMEELVKQVVAEGKAAASKNIPTATHIPPTDNLFLASASDVDIVQTLNQFDLVVDCNADTGDQKAKWVCLGCKEGKLGSRALREKLPQVQETVEQVLRKNRSARILVRCASGRDLSVGTLLVLLCCFFDQQGKVGFASDTRIDKQFIRQRLAWITSSKPDANPSRTTLQAVNAFLMNRPD